MVLASDYSSKGDEEMVEVRIGEDLVFIEKRYITIENVLDKAQDSSGPQTKPLEEDEEENNPSGCLDHVLYKLSKLSSEDKEKKDDNAPKIENGDEVDPIISIEDLNKEHDESQEQLAARLSKTLSDLQDIKKDMSNTFTSTDTISSTIVSVKGMIDAIMKDQLKIQEGMLAMERMNESKSTPLDPKQSVKYFIDMQDNLVKINSNALEKIKDVPDSVRNNQLRKELETHIEIFDELKKRGAELLKNDLYKSLQTEKHKKYPNSREEDRIINRIWFDSIGHWFRLLIKQN